MSETREFLVVLRILCDDPEDDPRLWDFDVLLAAPEGPEFGKRYARVVSEVEVKRGNG